MASEDSTIAVAVIAFGQVGEQLGGRHHERTVRNGLTVRDLVVDLGLEEWISLACQWR